MIIIFKLVGAFLGLKIALLFKAPPMTGVLIGALLGHSIDIVVATKIQRAKARRYYQAQANAQFGKVFLGTIFTMLGKLCTVDGDVTPAELQRVQKVIEEGIKLNRKERKEALQIFKNARRANSSFQFDAAQYYELYHRDNQALTNLIVLMYDVAAADGPVNSAEERLIRSAASVFNLPDDVYAGIRRSFGGSSASGAGGSLSAGDADDPYTVLGCSRNDPVSVIKKNYRKLVSDYHPDKILSKGLPEEFTRFANEKFKSIQHAYETVKTEKGFS
jgi:DnaJ like chaperone protein